MTVALLFFRPASAVMGTRCLQAHRVGYLLLVHFSSYRFPPRLLALHRDALLRRYLPTPVSLGPYE